ncbi:unnamed protein product [Durusdinium trenchii]
MGQCSWPCVCNWREETLMEDEVIHDLDSFECTDTVGGHLRFLKPKCDMVITAVRRGQAQVVRPDRQIILKKATANEKAFYEAEECASLESFLPMYYGCALVCTEFGNEDYLVLEDVALSNPVQCDVKLGFVQRAAHHSDAKWKSMRVKAAATTSAKVGFRHCGLTYCDWKSGIQVKEDKYAGQLVQAADLVSAFGKFFNQEPGRTWPLQGAFRKSVLKSISTIHALEGVIASLDGLRFWGASLLFMLDAEAIWNQDAACIEESLKIKLIDFGNAVFIGDGPDKEALCALTNLKSMLAAMLEKTTEVDPAFEVCRPDLCVQDAEQLKSMEGARMLASLLSPIHEKS